MKQVEISKPKIERIGSTIITCIGCYFLISLLLHSCSPTAEKIKPQLTSITESVYSSVAIQPDSMYAVYSAVNGILDRIYIEESDTVKIGDDLFDIVNNVPAVNIENARISMEQARSNYEGSATRLNELQNEIEAAKLKFHDDSTKFDKQQRLWKQGIGTQNDLDNLELAVRLSKNNMLILKNRLIRTKYDLDAQLRTATNNYQNSLNVNEDYTIRSKINGKVYEVIKNPGEQVSGQEPLAYVGSKDDFIIELLVDEVDIGRIELAQKLLVVLDVFGEEVFEATVSSISPKMDDRTQTFLVKGAFIEQPSPLYSGLTGEANIIISKREQVLTIPLNYLINKERVLTEDGEVTVKTGIQDLEMIEIISGIDTSTVLIKP